ncbi:MAG: hypothetical protein HY027_04650 [Deltaproteobacteria bacterium]|nr:hypothetical protein [Deltaproteobacteria bacterium]
MLTYASDRVPGRKDGRTIDIPLSRDTLPEGVFEIELEVEVAGRLIRQSFPPQPNQHYLFTWDGFDAYGRRVIGTQPATVRVIYDYPAYYTAPPIPVPHAGNLSRGVRAGEQSFEVRSFAEFGSGLIQLGHSARAPFQAASVLHATLVGSGGWDASGVGLGGWDLSDHHVYDPIGRVLYLGDGSRRSEVDTLGPEIDIVVGNGVFGETGDGGPARLAAIGFVKSLTMGPDGSLYILDSANRIHRVDINGIISTVAGGGGQYETFEIPARDADLAGTLDIAVGADGSIYGVDLHDFVFRIDPSGVLHLFAGQPQTPGGYNGDEIPAVQAQVNFPVNLAVGGDGSVYFAEYAGQRIRRVGPDGIIHTVGGNGNDFVGYYANPPDGVPASTALGGGFDGLVVAPDGSVYFGWTHGRDYYFILRINTAGIVSVAAGGGDEFVDGKPATEEYLNTPGDISLGPDGSLFYAQAGGSTTLLKRLRGGIATIVAGNRAGGFLINGDGGPAVGANIGFPGYIAVDPAGDIYIGSPYGNATQVRRIRRRLPGLDLSDLLIPSEDGSVVYRFDASGRHLETRHALTGAVLLSFGYDAGGRLISITEKTGGTDNATTIEHDGNGNPTGIVGPYGQRTTLSVDANGWLSSLSNPANETMTFESSADGLMTSRTTPRGFTYTYEYDALGLLTHDIDPAGGSQILARSVIAPNATISYGDEVTRTTGLGRTTDYRVEFLSDGTRHEVVTAPSGTKRESLYGKDSSRKMSFADGTTIAGVDGPDPQFGMLAPVMQTLVSRTPGGLSLAIGQTATATQSNPLDPLSVTQLTRTFTINGRTDTSIYDAATKLFTNTTSANRQGTATIDDQGRGTAEQFGGLAPAAMTYDVRGRLITMTEGAEAEVRTTTYSYNAQSYVQTITDPIGRMVSFTYDAAGRPLTEMLPDGRVVTATYDPNGNLAHITPPGRLAHQMSYSPVDLETQYNPPDVVSVVPDEVNSSFSIDRQLTLLSRPDGASVTPVYDTAGRISSIAFSRGSLGMSYDTTTGLLTGITAPDGIGHVFGYDGDLLRSEQLTGPVPSTVAWTYDNDFRVASESVNGGNAASFSYDADSVLTQAGSLVVAPDAQSGLLAGTTLGGVTDSWIYNTHAEPTDYRVHYNGSDVYRAQYTRDGIGRITRKIESIAGTTDTFMYTYDLAGRLLTANKNATPISFTYDVNSSRTSYSGPLGDVSTTQYDAQDRMTQYGATSYVYNNTGDLVSKTEDAATTQYTYDELGNLTRVVLPDATRIDYVIDGRNRRIGKKINGVLNGGFLWDGALQIVAELDGDSALVSRFVYATHANVPDYVVQGGITYRIITDHLGSLRLVINTTDGSIVQRMNHDEFGRVTGDVVAGGFTRVPFGFAGGLYDPDTGLVRFGARDYDPPSGRWTTKAPDGFNGGVNLYEYAANDPVKLVDRTGLEPLVVAHVTEIRGRLRIRRGNRLINGYVGMQLYIGDVLCTDADSVAAIAFEIGGRAGVATNEKARIMGERGLKEQDVLREIQGRIAFGASCGRLKENLEICRDGGIMGISDRGWKQYREPLGTGDYMPPLSQDPRFGIFDPHRLRVLGH